MAHNKKLGAKHHEVIGQQSFLGASVINYTLNLGFGNQPSRLQLNLINDAEHRQNPEGKTRYYNAVHEGYHPWKETVLPFDLDVITHDDNLGGHPIDLPKGEEKYPPYKGGRLGRPVLEKINGPNPDTEGECAGADADNKGECLAATPAGIWTSAQQFAYKYGDKFFIVGNGKDAEGNEIKRTMIGSPVWFNWYRYDKVDAEDPSCGGGVECGKEGDILLRDFDKRHPWNFNGILTSVEVTNSSSSGRITNITVEDPRSILAGTHVILGKFQGRTMNADGSLGTITEPYPKRLYKHGFLGYYNVLNVYGFIEDVYGFGSVDKNEAGMIWWDESGKNSASERLVTTPPKDSSDNNIGTLDEYYQAPGTNIVDVLQWMLMGSADAVHGEKEYIGWPRVREPGTGFFKGYRYHGPYDDPNLSAPESDPAEQRPEKEDGYRVGQERYGGLLYYGDNPLVNDLSGSLIAGINPEQDYLYGPSNINSLTGYGTIPSQVNRFKVDLSELKDLHVDVHESGLLDSNFRIQADDISLLDLIQNICDYASADFFVELLPDIAPWPRGQKEMVCRDTLGNRVDQQPVGGDPITTDAECQTATANQGIFASEVITPQNGEGVTGVIKIRVVHRVKPPRPDLLGAMIEDSKFDAEHIDDGEDPDPAVFDPKDSKHFKKWRGRVMSSKIGYEFADLPTGKMLMGAPKTRMVGVDPLGEDFLRDEFGSCVDKDGIEVDLSSLSRFERKKACEPLGACYNPDSMDFVEHLIPDKWGSCAEQAAIPYDDTTITPHIAQYPLLHAREGEDIDNKADCTNGANFSILDSHTGGLWCPNEFLSGRQRTDFDGVEGPTNRDDIGGFFSTTNQMLEDQFGRDILGNQTLYERRDYRNDFWANSIKDQPHLMRISGPNGVDDLRPGGWGKNGTAGHQPGEGPEGGLTGLRGGDPNDTSTFEDMDREPLFGDGGADPVNNPGDHHGGDGYADLSPAWGLHDRPDYCKMITIDPPGSHDDTSRVCEDISGCTWRWEDPDDHDKGGKCGDTIPVKKKNVPNKGFFWDDEPQKDFNPANPDFGYPVASKPLSEDWGVYHPMAGLMSMYDWVEPNCDKDIYAFPACKAANTYKGQGYGSTPTGDSYENYTRPRLKRKSGCYECEEEYFVCHDTVNDTEALSIGATDCPAAGEKLTKQADCKNISCHSSPLIASGAQWIGGGCETWKEVENSLADVNECFCDNEEEFVDGIVPVTPETPLPPSTPPSCSGGNEKFNVLEVYDENGYNDMQSLSRMSIGAVGGPQLPDSAIIEIDMSEVYKETESIGFDIPVYKHGIEITGLNRENVYLATVTELRAAANNKSAWEDYIAQWGIKLSEDMNWTNNAHVGWFATMFEGSKGPAVGPPGVDGTKVAMVEKLLVGQKEKIGTKDVRVGEVTGPHKSTTDHKNLTNAPADERHTQNAVLDSETITKDMDTIFNKVQDIAQNWYGKAYLMPLPFDPEDITKHVRVANENYEGIELEAPKLDLDWDIAQNAFVEIEFDKLTEGHSLKYPLSKDFVSEDGKMTGFFVYPQEYKGIEPVNSKEKKQNPLPSPLSVSVNSVATDGRYVSLKDFALPLGSVKRGKVFVKTEVDSETFWLWDNDRDIIDYIDKKQMDPDFKLRDAFDLTLNGECEGEPGVDHGDAPSADKEACLDDDAGGTCSGNGNSHGGYITRLDCESNNGTWTSGTGRWISGKIPALRPYALLKISAPVEHDEGRNARERAMAGKAAVAFVFDSLFDWDVTATGASIFSGVASDVMRAGLVPARFKPFGAAVPQVSNRHVWGPWSLGMDFGKTEVQKDNTFQPSNFGSIEDMNKAAISKINADLVSQQITESGFVELTGAPEYALGTPIGNDEDFSRYLSNIGATGSITPYITDVAVDTNPSAGVTTKYTMRTWTPRLGKLEEWKLKQGVKQTRDLLRSDMEKNDREYKQLRMERTIVPGHPFHGRSPSGRPQKDG